MVLAFDARPSTKDVDAIFEPSAVVRRLSVVVAAELGLPEDWLNDAAKGFASARRALLSQELGPSTRAVPVGGAARRVERARVMTRPQSMAEVARRAGDVRAFFYEVMDFVDELRRRRDPAMLVEEPCGLSGRFEQGSIADAYLAAVAVSLARELRVVPPAWALSDSRKLTQPWFAHAGAALRATLLAESPAPFRERNLFVSANALARA